MPKSFQKILLLLFLAILLGVKSEDSNILDSMPDLVDELWNRVSNNWIITTGANMATFFSRYDPKQQSSLSLFEHRFVSGEKNFVEDFREYGVTYETAKAYFRSMDVIEYWLYMKLTIEDMDFLVDICDKHTKGMGLGFISGSQFKKGFTQVVFRGLPFSLMYTQYKSIEPAILKPKMNYHEFLQIFQDMDRNRDNNVTAEEVGHYWEDRRYGPYERGKEYFQSLNYRNSSFLTVTDWEDLLKDLDCISEKGSKDGKLTHREFLQMDEILHGLRVYPPQKNCTIKKGIITPGVQKKTKSKQLLKKHNSIVKS